MRRNIEEVLTYWRQGRQRNRARQGHNSIWTDGASIYSYATEIMRQIQGVTYLNVRRYTRTTSCHQNALERYLRANGTSYRRVDGEPTAAYRVRVAAGTQPAPAPAPVGPIRGYHTSREIIRPLPSPSTRAYGGRFFGVELEVERSSGATDSKDVIAQRIADWVNNQAGDITSEGHRDTLLHFERDGSLSDGFEMVSAPMGMDDHARLWKTALTPTLVGQVRSHDTSTCGLHVHMSRTGLSDLHISKMVCFVNDPDNMALIKAVARRYGEHYCNVRRKRLATAHQRDGDRYQAVNLCNEKTIEFRIFKGTLKYAAVMAAIEFTNAVADFCNPTGAAGFNLKTPAFLDFINTVAMRKRTRYLRLYLAERMRGQTFPTGFVPVMLA